MDETIYAIIESYYPNLTTKEKAICKQVVVTMWDLKDIEEDIENGYL